MSSKTEAGKNPNYCSWCDVACGTRTGLKEHMTTVHGVVYNELQTYVLGIKRKSESDPNEVQCSPEKRRKTMDRWVKWTLDLKLCFLLQNYVINVEFLFSTKCVFACITFRWHLVLETQLILLALEPYKLIVRYANTQLCTYMQLQDQRKLMEFVKFY